MILVLSTAVPSTAAVPPCSFFVSVFVFISWLVYVVIFVYVRWHGITLSNLLPYSVFAVRCHCCLVLFAHRGCTSISFTIQNRHGLCMCWLYWMWMGRKNQFVRTVHYEQEHAAHSKQCLVFLCSKSRTTVRLWTRHTQDTTDTRDSSVIWSDQPAKRGWLLCFDVRRSPVLMDALGWRVVCVMYCARRFFSEGSSVCDRPSVAESMKARVRKFWWTSTSRRDAEPSLC